MRVTTVTTPTAPERSTPAAQLELVWGLGDLVSANLSLLSPIDKAWQPTDYLPDLAAPSWREQLADFRASAEQLSDEVLVVLVGNMVTEEALPNYSVSLNLVVRDEHGNSDLPWARWLRGWTAEENRHGDLLNAFLRLTGRVDMRAVEVTVHHLLNNGFSPQVYPDIYAGLVYTSFQERATCISHHNVAALAAAQGDERLAAICRRISGDEARHETFYTRIMAGVLDADPDRGMLSFASILRRLIAMPGKLMYDGRDPNLFDHFAVVAQRLEVYTARDYANIIRHFVDTWSIPTRIVSGEAARSQEYLCRQADRLDHLADAVGERLAEEPPVRFRWIYDRLA